LTGVTTLFLTSRLLSATGVAHGFSLRTGGVSQGALASLNLGRAVGDVPAAVEENLSRLAAAAGLSGPGAFRAAAQVHGDRVLQVWGTALVELLAGTESAQVSGESAAALLQAPAGDAVVSLAPGQAAAVRVADCVPILLYEPRVRAAAAVHAGWRGARLWIPARGVQALQTAAGASPAQVLAAVGPCIGRCCYEVSPELAGIFRGLFGEHVADDPARSERPHLDLRAAVEVSLRRAGLGAARIEHVGGCTSCDPQRYFSHRRDRGRTGRHLAFLAPDSL
jgi:YfiH family protein